MQLCWQLSVDKNMICGTVLTSETVVLHAIVVVAQHVDALQVMPQPSLSCVVCDHLYHMKVPDVPLHLVYAFARIGW